VKKKNFLERKCIAAKLAKFRPIVFYLESAFGFFSFTVLCPENWSGIGPGGLPPPTFSPLFFLNIVFSRCLVSYFLDYADAKFPFFFSLFFLFFWAFFGCVECWMRLTDTYM
jgi:hypothetical protein